MRRPASGRRCMVPGLVGTARAAIRPVRPARDGGQYPGQPGRQVGDVAQLEHRGLVGHVQVVAERAQGAAEAFDDIGMLAALLGRGEQPGDQRLVGGQVAAAADGAGQRMAGDQGAAALDQQFGAGAEEAVDPEDHARGVQGEQPGQDIRGDERAIGRHVDLPGQDYLAQCPGVDAGDCAGHQPAPGVVIHHRGQGELARRRPGIGEPAERIGGHLAGQPGGGRAVPGAGHGGDPCFPVAAADHHAGDDQRPGCFARERQRPECHRPGSRPGHVVAAPDGGQAGGNPGHRGGVGETAGQLDAQGDAAPGQPEALVLPQDAVTAGRGQ